MRVDVFNSDPATMKLHLRLHLREYLAMVHTDTPVFTGIELPAPLSTAYTPMTGKRASDNVDDDGYHDQYDWALGADWDKAVDLAALGWVDAPDVSKLKRMVANAAGLHNAGFDIERKPVGPMLDVEAYNAGMPDCFYDFAEVPAQPKITIGFELASNCNVKANHMAYRGAVVFALADWLRPHAMTEVVAFVTMQSGSRTICTEIVVANEEYPMDNNGLAFFTAHPAAFRRLFFRFMELWPDIFRRDFGVGHGYGRAGSLPEGWKREKPEVYLGNTCPTTPEQAIGSLKALARAVKKEFFHGQS